MAFFGFSGEYVTPNYAHNQGPRWTPVVTHQTIRIFPHNAIALNLRPPSAPNALRAHGISQRRAIKINAKSKKFGRKIRNKVTTYKERALRLHKQRTQTCNWTLKKRTDRPQRTHIIPPMRKKPTNAPAIARNEIFFPETFGGFIERAKYCQRAPPNSLTLRSQTTTTKTCS